MSGGGKGPKIPPPPDPFETASAQQGLNVSTALAQSALNQYEEVTPYGRSYYEPTGQVRTFGSGGEYTGMAPAGGMGGGGAGANPVNNMLYSLFVAPGLSPSDRRKAEARLGGGGGGGGFGGDLGAFSIPSMRRVTEFSPEQQRIFEAEMGLTGDLYDLAAGYTGRIAEGLKDPFSFEGMPDAPVADQAARQQVIDALYGQHASRLDPEFAQQEEQLRTRLANQGITAGSAAYLSEMDRFSRGRNDAYLQARNASIAGGGAEQSRLFGLDASARERAIQEAAYLRDRPINEITALTSGRGLTMPQFSATPQTAINAADYQGAAYASHQAQAQAAQMAQQAQQALMGNIFGLGGSILGGAGAAGGFGKLFSDKRLKEDIHDTGISVDGIPVKTWEWKGTGEPDIGFIAQDVERKRPDMVDKDHPSGFRRVDYGRMIAEALAG